MGRKLDLRMWQRTAHRQCELERAEKSFSTAPTALAPGKGIKCRRRFALRVEMPRDRIRDAPNPAHCVRRFAGRRLSFRILLSKAHPRRWVAIRLDKDVRGRPTNPN